MLLLLIDVQTISIIRAIKHNVMNLESFVITANLDCRTYRNRN